MAEVFAQQQFGPNRHAQQSLGYQLRGRRRDERPRAAAVARASITPPAGPSSISADIDFELFRIFAAVGRTWPTATRTASVLGGQFDQLLHNRQMAVIAARRTGVAFPLPARLGREGFAVGFFARQMVGAIAGGGVLAFLAVESGLELADFTPQLFVFDFQLGDPSHRIRMARLPIAGLLPQDQILPPHLRQFLTQRGDLPFQLLDKLQQLGGIAAPPIQNNLSAHSETACTTAWRSSPDQNSAETRVGRRFTSVRAGRKPIRKNP